MPRTSQQKKAAKKKATSKRASRRTQPLRSTRKDLNASEQTVGQDRPRTLRSTGPAADALEPQHIEPVDGPLNPEKAAALAFMEEELLVVVHDSTNDNDEPIPAVWNSGRAQYFIRGQHQRVKRKFVEVLARLKITKYTQRLEKDGAGNDTYKNIPHTALRFPFSVIEDPSGQKGADWLKRVLAEG